EGVAGAGTGGHVPVKEDDEFRLRRGKAVGSEAARVTRGSRVAAEASRGKPIHGWHNLAAPRRGVDRGGGGGAGRAIGASKGVPFYTFARRAGGSVGGCGSGSGSGS
ncbi:unnamed protein product, partial [Laminaria digitata]